MKRNAVTVSGCSGIALGGQLGLVAGSLLRTVPSCAALSSVRYCARAISGASLDPLREGAYLVLCNSCKVETVPSLRMCDICPMLSAHWLRHAHANRVLDIFRAVTILENVAGLALQHLANLLKRLEAYSFHFARF